MVVLTRNKHLILGLLVVLLVLSGLPYVLSRISGSNKYAGCKALTASGEVDPRDTLAVWLNRPISPLLADSGSLTGSSQVLGTATGEKWIEIDLSDQKLIAHQGDTIVLESLISSGLWNRTPVGEYRIWYKIRSTKMEGGSKLNNSYYYLPNVPYAMFFNGDIGIHGTYWHSDFGRPKSHGCVNAPTSVAESLFYWTDPQLSSGQKAFRSTPDNPGTRVVVHK